MHDEKFMQKKKLFHFTLILFSYFGVWDGRLFFFFKEPPNTNEVSTSQEQIFQASKNEHMALYM